MANHNEDDEELSDLSFDEEDQDPSDEFDEFDEELFKEIEAENLLDAEQERKEEAAQAALEATEASQEEHEEPPAAQPEIKGPLSLDRLPVSVVVEIGSIPMTMDKLLKIEQGNLLDVTVNPANGVDLTINGKVVAKGELVKVGENLGVRILELG